MAGVSGETWQLAGVVGLIHVRKTAHDITPWLYAQDNLRDGSHQYLHGKVRGEAAHFAARQVRALHTIQRLVDCVNVFRSYPPIVVIAVVLTLLLRWVIGDGCLADKIAVIRQLAGDKQITIQLWIFPFHNTVCREMFAFWHHFTIKNVWGRKMFAIFP